MAKKAQKKPRRKKGRATGWQPGPTLQADRQAARSRREVSSFTGQRRRLWKQTMRRTKEADLRRRYQVVWQWMEGFSKTAIAKMLCCHRNTVANVLKTFLEQGELGLVDGRVANGSTKALPVLVCQVEKLVSGTPPSKWNHSTWTQELLTLVAAEKTGIKVSISTMCRVLKCLKARKGRPRPTVGCPWPAWKRQRRLRELRKLIETLPADEIVLFADEVDIHLNPKIGPDWMLPGTQKTVVTPGRNQRHYVCGAMTSWGKDLIWVEGKSKCSALFVQLIHQLCDRFQNYRVIHLIVDNYIVHTSKITQKAIESKVGKVQLHFLPPYCPKHNPIERLWRDLHARVTRNHQCKTIRKLMAQVTRFLDNLWTDRRKAILMAA